MLLVEGYMQLLRVTQTLELEHVEPIEESASQPPAFSAFSQSSGFKFYMKDLFVWSAHASLLLQTIAPVWSNQYADVQEIK